MLNRKKKKEGKTHKDGAPAFPLGVVEAGGAIPNLAVYLSHVLMQWPLTNEIMAEMLALPRGLQANA